MSEGSHSPVRSCVGCGQRDRQSSMVRLVRNAADGALRIDVRRRLPGRGAYLHRVDECVTRFAKRRGMIRSLRAAVDTPARARIVRDLRERSESRSK